MPKATSLLVLAIAGLLLATFSSCDAHSDELMGKCKPIGLLRPSESRPCKDCCKPGESYKTYKCSPPTSGHTKAIMTLKDFDEGGPRGGPSECDGKYHKNKERVVALSTGWYNKGKRCNKNIRIHAKGKSVLAMVVDECDSMHGCDRERAYQPPCRPNVVEASKPVWDEMGIKSDKDSEYEITWSDA